MKHTNNDFESWKMDKIIYKYVTMLDLLTLSECDQREIMNKEKFLKVMQTYSNFLGCKKEAFKFVENSFFLTETLQTVKDQLHNDD